MNKAVQEFALLSFMQEWLTRPREWPAKYTQSHPAWAAVASQTVIAEALMWRDWGIELGFFPEDTGATVSTSQLAAFRQALAVVSTEPAYKLTVPAWGRSSADETDLRGEAPGRGGGSAAPASLHAHFQHLAMLAASFAKQDPAAIMLTTITLERPLGRVSFYERPAVVAQLTGAQVGAALAPWDEPINESSTPQPTLAGALGIAGLLQTLDYFASIKRSFDTLYRLIDSPASQSASGEPGPSSRLTADDVKLFERGFVACQGWRINLSERQILRRFTTLLDFASDLISEELMIDKGRVIEHVVRDRTAARVGIEESDSELLARFSPDAAVAEWRHEAEELIGDWIRRLRGTIQGREPPSTMTAR